MYLKQFGWIFILFLQVFALQGSECPHPASNFNTIVKTTSLSVASVATYTCDPGYELFGSSTRTCLDSGLWEGDVPVCATNVATGKPVNQSSTVRGGEGVNANDGDTSNVHDGNKCTQTTTEESPWWSVDLLQPYEVTSIRITTRGCCGQNPLQDLEIRIGNSEQLVRNRLCNWVPGIIEEGSTKELACVRPMVGRYVFIQMSGVHGSMSLCEVEVFSKDEFSKERCVADVDKSHIGLFNQTCYEFQVSSGGTFDIAQKYCLKRREGNLVHRITPLAQQFLVSELERLEGGMDTKMVWIGVEKEPSFISRKWHWIDGVDITHPSWGRDQPNNYNGEQNCVVLDGSRKWLWNDVGCSLNYLFWMCQFQPSCGTPDRTLNTTFTVATDLNSQSVAKYSCPEGHKVVGEMNRQCESTGYWNGSAPSCKYIDCGNPNSIEHGSMTLVDARTTYAARASYSCHENYTMQGEDTISCGDESKWNVDVPQCLYSWCPELEDLRNGVIVSDGRRSGDNATFSCHPGYFLVGSESLSCKLGGQWNGDPPACNFVDCGQPENLENGKMTLVNGSTYFNSISTYECHEDFYLEGLSTRRCESSGFWAGERPSCGRIDCGEPEIPVGGYVTGYSFFVHSSVEYHCEDGHYMTGETKRSCMRNSQWSGNAPNCTFVECGRLPPIIKGEVRYVSKGGSTYLDSEAMYSCNQNYRMKGEPHRMCERDAKWTGETPTCEEIRCSEANHPPKSRITISGDGRRLSLTVLSRDNLSGNRTYKIGSQVTYRCERGHAVSGSTIRTCLATGLWSATAPNCSYVNCGTPESISMGIFRLLSNETHYGAIAGYECDMNWKIVGKIRRYCQENGTWSTPVPTCQEVLCPSLSKDLAKRYQGLDKKAKESSWDTKFIAKHGEDSKLRLEVEEGERRIGTSAKYRCKEGRRMLGEDTRLCKQHGVWDGSEPNCEWIFCSKPDNIVNGRVHILSDSFVYGSVVEYFCFQKYSINGPFNRTCSKDGAWSGPNPTCVLNDYNLGIFGDNTIDGTTNLAQGPPNRSYTEPSYTGIYVGVAVSLILALGVGLTLLFFKVRKSKADKTPKTMNPPPKAVDNGSTVMAYGDLTDHTTGNNIYEHIPDDLGPSYANITPSDSFSSSNSYKSPAASHHSANDLNNSHNNNQYHSGDTAHNNERNTSRHSNNGVPHHISMRPRMPPPQPPQVPSGYQESTSPSGVVTVNGISIGGNK